MLKKMILGLIFIGASFVSFIFINSQTAMFERELSFWKNMRVMSSLEEVPGIPKSDSPTPPSYSIGESVVEGDQIVQESLRIPPELEEDRSSPGMDELSDKLYNLEKDLELQGIIIRMYEKRSSSGHKDLIIAAFIGQIVTMLCALPTVLYKRWKK